MKSEDEDDLSTAEDGSTTSYTTATSDTDDKDPDDDVRKQKLQPSKSFHPKGGGGGGDDGLALAAESAIPRRMNVRMRGSRGRPRSAHRLKIRFQSRPRGRARGPGRPRGVRSGRPRGRPPLKGRLFLAGDDAASRLDMAAAVTKNGGTSVRRLGSRAGRGGGRVGLSSGRQHRPADSGNDVKRETVDTPTVTPAESPPVKDTAETSKKESDDAGSDQPGCNGDGQTDSATNGCVPAAVSTTPSESSDREPETSATDTRTFWRPPEEARPILDQVFITDVTANRVTVTVRESHTDTGFFRKREVENWTKFTLTCYGEMGGGETQRGQRSCNAERMLKVQSSYNKLYNKNDIFYNILTAHICFDEPQFGSVFTYVCSIWIFRLEYHVYAYSCWTVHSGQMIVVH